MFRRFYQDIRTLYLLARDEDQKLLKEQLHYDEDLNYASSATAAMLQQSPRGGQKLIWSIAVFFACFLIWASWAELDEFARGEGRVIPSQHIQVVQNLEGGILAELHVDEGDEVERNQPLLRIDDTRFSSSLREAKTTLSQLEIKSMRLRAEAEGIPFVVDATQDWPDDIVAQEIAFHQSKLKELQSNTQVFQQQVSQKRQEVSELRAKTNQLQTSVDLLNEELELTRPLADEGAISQVELLRLQRQLNDLKGELKSAELALPRAISTLEEAKEKLANVELVFLRESREELNEVTLELSRLKETSSALADRVRRTLVLSPVNGTVKRLLVKTIGGVIQPGMDIVEVVPSEERLVIEVMIRPSDIAFLHPDQKAKVKFTAYDFAIMGGLDGEVTQISPDTIVDEQGDSFYSVRIETTKAFIGPDGTELPIIPGMTVNVDILTGKKTILDYILKPILKTKQLAMRER